MKPAKFAGQDAERAWVCARARQGQRTFSQQQTASDAGDGLERSCWQRPCRTLPVVPCSRRHYLPESPRSRSHCKPIHPSRSTQVLHDTDYGGKRLTYDFFCKAQLGLKPRLRDDGEKCLCQALCLVAVNMYPNMDWEASRASLPPSFAPLSLPSESKSRCQGVFTVSVEVGFGCSGCC